MDIHDVLRLTSNFVNISLFPQDPEVDNFFRHCQKFDGSPAADIEMVKLLKVLSRINLVTNTKAIVF